MSEMIKLQTMDGEIVEVEKKIACVSGLVKGIVDDSGVDDEIPLPQVKKAILDKIIKYCTSEIEKSLISNELSDVVNPW